MRAAPGLAITIAVVVGVLGCGGTSKETISVREAASADLAKGEEAFSAHDYASATPHFESCVNSGGLNPDAYAAAAVKLVVCYGAAGKYDEAMKLLEILERGAPNLDQVFAARAFVLKKQGKGPAANAAFAQARRYNRDVKEFK